MSFLNRYFDWRCAPTLAFPATVALAYLATFWEGAVRIGTVAGAWCLALGAVYAVLGIVDYSFLWQAAGRGGRALYLGVQGGLLLGIIWTSRLSGEIPLCVYPLVAVIVALLPRVPAALGLAVLYGLVLAVEGHFYGTAALGRWSISMLPGFAFVAIFTWMALREKALRARAENLAGEVGRLAVIRERNRLAGEIHDSLGHFLTTIHVQLEAARAIHPSDPARALEAVAQARDLAGDALVEVRRSVGTLRADRPPAPLPALVRDLTAASDGWGVAISLEICGESRELAPEMEHALFRAIQEGLTNVRKHAGARAARVTLDYRDSGRFSICVADDGRGAPSDVAGHGLSGLRDRIAALGGCVTAASPPGGGFRLQVELPT